MTIIILYLFLVSPRSFFLKAHYLSMTPSVLYLLLFPTVSPQLQIKKSSHVSSRTTEKTGEA